MATAADITLPAIFSKYNATQRAKIQQQIFNQLRAQGADKASSHPLSTLTTSINITDPVLLSPYTVMKGTVNKSNADVPPFWHDYNGSTHVYGLVPGGVYQVFSIGTGRFNNTNLSCAIKSNANQRFWCYPSLLHYPAKTPSGFTCGTWRWGTGVADENGHFYWKFTLWEGAGSRCYNRGTFSYAQSAWGGMACNDLVDAYRIVPIFLSFTITVNNPFFDDNRIVVPGGTTVTDTDLRACVRERYIQHVPHQPIYEQPFDYDFIQSFYVDKSQVAGASTVDLTSVDLYFKKKPQRSRARNKSGITAPSVWISIIDIDSKGKPTERTYAKTRLRKSYDQITTSTDATIATKFSFPEPVRVATNRKYGIKIAYEDEDYDLWASKVGHKLVGTNNPSNGSTATHDGDIYQSTNVQDVMVDATSETYRTLGDIDLKFNVNVARYQSDSIDLNVRLVPKDFEFFSLDALTDQPYFSGEIAYQEQLHANGSWNYNTGTITTSFNNTEVIGVGTSFDTLSIEPNSYIYVTDGGSNSAVYKVDSITNATKIRLGDQPSFEGTGLSWALVPAGVVVQYNHFSKTVVLKNSTANSTLYFANNSTGQLVGSVSGGTSDIAYLHAIAVNKFTTDLNFNASQATTVEMVHNFAYWDGTNHRINSVYERPTDLQGINHIQNYSAVVMSRSMEVTDPTYLTVGDAKSSYFELNATYDNQLLNQYVYEAPVVMSGGLNIVAHKFYAGNISTNEHKNKGDALARHISKKVTLIDDKVAEDLLVYMTAYKPLGTDIKIYGKIHNSDDSESFEDKEWTELAIGYNNKKFSSTADRTDIIEYGYTFPSYPEIESTLSGVVTTDNTTTVTGVSTSFTTALAPNQVIRIYDTLIPENYFIAVVDSITNNTSLELKDFVANTSLQGSGFKINTLKYETTAFKNQERNNTVRYYNSNASEFDGFNSFAIKVVLLTDSPVLIPYVDDIRAMGVSA